MYRSPSEARKLNFLSFVSQSQQQSINEFAIENGYSVRILEPSKPDTAKNEIVVLVIGKDRPEYTDILQAVQGIPRQLRLGLFFGGPHESDMPLLDSIGEFVTWPCDGQEFRLRMARMCQIEMAGAGSQEKNKKEFRLVGSSAEFDKVVRLVETFQACDAPVLIEGETGTGKEVVARAIHYKSARHGHPFIPVNCGALPDSLVENELYGHARGAYTDAKTEQSGFVGQAEGGTLFLDEIEALSPKAQVSLLRFLQEYQYRPLGKGKTLQANVRVIAASNVDIGRLVETGQLRQDLYFRLNILRISLPPLRERPEDIIELIEYFLEQYCRQYKVARKGLHPELYDILLDYKWPGNVREVENSVHRAVLMSQGEILTPSEFNLNTEDSSPEPNGIPAPELRVLGFHAAKMRAIETFERRYLQRIMKEAQGNVSEAARYACKERRALGKLLKKYGIDRNDFI